MKDNFLNYYKYLKTTSIKGKITENFSYPFLSIFLKGHFLDVCG